MCLNAHVPNNRISVHINDCIQSTPSTSTFLPTVSPASMSEDSRTASPPFTVASSGEDLRYAARVGDLDEAREVLNRYSDTNDPLPMLLPAVVASGDGLSGNKALHLCAANGHLELVQLLLEHNAEVNVINLSGSTPLHYASFNGQLDIVQELIQHKASAVVENIYGKTALDEARLGGQDEVAEFLLDYVEKTGNALDFTKESEEQAVENADKN